MFIYNAEEIRTMMMIKFDTRRNCMRVIVRGNENLLVMDKYKDLENWVIKEH